MKRFPLLGLLLAATTVHAQQRPDSSSFMELRLDGNGISALRAELAIGFVDLPAAKAFTQVADLARLNITFDPRLSNLDVRINIASHERTAAAALIELGAATRIRIMVSARGQIVLSAAGPAITQKRDSQPELARQLAVAIPGLRIEAAREERAAFETSTNVSGISMSAEALRSSPSFVEPDVLRAIQLLPGIEARSDWAAGFNVRGGEADQSLVLLDGYPVYNPFHLGGVFSTFIDAAVGRVELHTGALPARYGGRVSGVLDVHSAEPTSKDMHGKMQVSLISSSVLLDKHPREVRRRGVLPRADHTPTWS